jgi:hypothetical protein
MVCQVNQAYGLPRKWNKNIKQEKDDANKKKIKQMKKNGNTIRVG